MDVAEEIGKRKDRAKRFGLPVPVFAAEVGHHEHVLHNSACAAALMWWGVASVQSLQAKPPWRCGAASYTAWQPLQHSAAMHMGGYDRLRQ